MLYTKSTDTNNFSGNAGGCAGGGGGGVFIDNIFVPPNERISLNNSLNRDNELPPDSPILRRQNAKIISAEGRSVGLSSV
jgi:hypothetical protein